MEPVNLYYTIDFFQYPKLQQLLKDPWKRSIVIPRDLFTKREESRLEKIKLFLEKLWHSIRWFFSEEYRRDVIHGGTRLSSQIIQVKDLNDVPIDVRAFFIQKEVVSEVKEEVEEQFSTGIDAFLRAVNHHTNGEMKKMFTVFFNHFKEECRGAEWIQKDEDSYLLNLKNPLYLWTISDGEYRGGLVLILDESVEVKFHFRKLEFVTGFNCYIHPEDLKKELPWWIPPFVKEAIKNNFTPRVFALENTEGDALIFTGGGQIGSFHRRKGKNRTISGLIESWAEATPLHKGIDHQAFVDEAFKESERY